MTDNDKQRCHDCQGMVEVEIHEFGGREQVYCSECGVRLGYA